MARLNWGLVGGGKGSQIGPAHLLGARADGNFVLAAGALDVDAERGRAYAAELGVEPDRAYADWQEMLAGEKARDDRVDLVTVATPNSTHFEITKAFLEAGFSVLCEKPMTMTVEEGEEIAKVARASGKICAVNYCYSAYPMVREMRQMVASGEIGKVRLVVANFSLAITVMRQMPTTRVCVGGMIRQWQACQANSPTAVFTHCIWLASLRAMRLRRCRLTSLRPFPAASWRTTRWSTSA